MKKYITLICIILSFACVRSGQDKSILIVENLPGPIEVESQAIKIPPILLKPVKTCVVDSFLIIAQSRPDSIFSVFKLPDCKYLLSFGARGRGPGEFFDHLPSLTLAPVFTRHSSFAVVNNRNNIQYYRLNELIKGNFFPYKTEIPSSDLDGFQTIGYFDDTLLIAAPYRYNELLIKYLANSHKITPFKKYPYEYPFEDLNNLRNVYVSFMTVKQDNSKFALAYSNKGEIEIYSSNNNVPVSIFYKGFPSLEENFGLNSNSRYIPHIPENIFCWEITSTNRYIYAKIFNDKYWDISDGKGLKRSRIAEIHIFDWSGSFITRLKPDFYYSEFNVDKNDRYLYTIDENTEDIVRRYDLQEVFKNRIPNFH